MNFFRQIFDMITYKTDEEIELIRDSALLVSKTLAMIAEEIRAGISTLYLDRRAEQFIRDNYAAPGFLGLYGYKYTICTSVNDQVVHGFPSHYIIRDGDIVTVDCGVFKNGFYGDHAYTFCIGEVSISKRNLVDATYQALYKGIEQIKLFNRVGDISYSIQKHAEDNNFSVVRELVGHGIGRKLHEKPQIPNFGKAHRGPILRNGVVLSLEPMLNMGSREIYTQKDGWTIVTRDHQPSAHFEHNIALVDGKYDILSDYKLIEDVLAAKGDYFPNLTRYIQEAV